MKRLKTFVGTVAVCVSGWAILAIPADAAPYPDRPGMCYFFKGDQQELAQSCTISSGYGAGAHYAVLKWPDGVQTRIIMINSCPNQDYDSQGFCRYKVDDDEAQSFIGQGNLDCYRINKTGNSVCYRLNQ